MIPRLAVCLLLVAITGCSGSPAGDSGAVPPKRETESRGGANKDESNMNDNPDATTRIATFGAGCFWCVEAVLEKLDGVKRVTSGYMGGRVKNPTYQQICTGTTGHAEVVQVTFDPQRIRYPELLRWFWKLHDPTTLNRQGNDVGTQYRSVIFYHSPDQKAEAEASRKAADASGAFEAPIVTEIAAADVFYPAEDYHQDYYRNNRNEPYCQFVISPKLDKLGLDD
jgi:peptide-methionine (S)-S-oxide reductase